MPHRRIQDQWEDEFNKRMEARAERKLPQDIARAWYGEERRTGRERRKGQLSSFTLFTLGFTIGTAVAFAAGIMAYIWP